MAHHQKVLTFLLHPKPYACSLETALNFLYRSNILQKYQEVYTKNTVQLWNLRKTWLQYQKQKVQTKTFKALKKTWIRLTHENTLIRYYGVCPHYNTQT